MITVRAKLLYGNWAYHFFAYDGSQIVDDTVYCIKGTLKIFDAEAICDLGNLQEEGITMYTLFGILGVSEHVAQQPSYFSRQFMTKDSV